MAAALVTVATDEMSRANAAILMLMRRKDQYVGKAFLIYFKYREASARSAA
jgi:hypothetical protein